MTILKGQIMKDSAGHTYLIDRLEKAFVYILTHPPVKGEQAIPVPVHVVERMTVIKGAA